MYPIDFTSCTALDVIQRSMTCHPSLFAASLRQEAEQDRAYASGKAGALFRAVTHRADAAERAAAVVGEDDASALLNDMAAGIVAYVIACRLQLVPNDKAMRDKHVLAVWPLREGK